jgi:hypothetical protein
MRYNVSMATKRFQTARHPAASHSPATMGLPALTPQEMAEFIDPMETPEPFDVAEFIDRHPELFDDRLSQKT